MKTHKRSVPMDALCIEHGAYVVRLMTHHHKITVSITKNGQDLVNEWLTPEQLISLLMSRTPDR